MREKLNLDYIEMEDSVLVNALKDLMGKKEILNELKKAIVNQTEIVDLRSEA